MVKKNVQSKSCDYNKTQESSSEFEAERNRISEDKIINVSFSILPRGYYRVFDKVRFGC